MKFYKNLFTSATKLGLAMLVVVGNIQNGFTSSSLEGQRSGWSGGGSTGKSFASNFKCLLTLFLE